MTVSPVQIIQAQAKGLINVVHLAAACNKWGCPFWLACLILDKETDGRNIYGHDVGGIYTYPDGRNIEVTEANYTEFLRRLAAGKRSNGVGPQQLTYRGYHIGPLSLQARGYKAWLPRDNMLYGVELLAKSWKAKRANGLNAKDALWAVAKSYNGGSGYADDAVKKMAGWLAAVGDTDTKPAPPPPPEPGDTVAERIPFRGGLTCSCVVESLPWVELDMIRRGIIKQSIDIKQLGYRGDVSASAGTHDRGGCVDVAQRSRAALEVWRRWGWTMQDRSPWFPNAPHAHGWPYGCPHLSDAAKDQNRDWNNRRNGLVNNQLVIGLWPVDKWDVAIERMVPTLFTAKDIADELVKQGAAFGKAFAKGFLSADDIVTSGSDEPNDANKFQAPKTFVTGDHDLLVDIREVLEKIAAKP